MKARTYLSGKNLTVILASFSLLVAAAIITKPKVAEAAQDCTRYGSALQSWNFGGYRYVTYVIGIDMHNSADTVIQNANDPDVYWRSQWCNNANTNDYGGGNRINGARVNPNPDFIAGDSDLLAWIQTAGGSRRVRPSGVELGIPPNAGAPNGGTWGNAGCAVLNTTPEPPIADCNNNPYDAYCQGFYTTNPTSVWCPALGTNRAWFQYGGGRQAAVVDDAGRLVVGGGTGDRTIWCAALVTGYTAGGANGRLAYEDCPPDVIFTGNPADPPNYANGAGFLLRRDQCLLTDYPPNGYYDTINGGCNAYDNWYANHWGSVDFTDHIQRDAGYLVGWYHHYDSRNTRPGGFGVEGYYTLRYTLNAATCNLSIIPSNPIPNQPITIQIQLTNTGTRPWRSSDGHLVRHTGGFGSGTYAVPNGTHTTGETITINIPAIAPGSSQNTTWMFSQDMIGAYQNIVSCSGTIAVGPPPGFTITPGANVGNIVPDPESPQTVELNTSATVTIGGPAPTVVNGITITRRYYIDRLSGPDTNLSGPTTNTQSLSGSQSGVTTNFGPVQFNVASLGLVAGDQFCAEITVTPTSGTVDFNGNQYPNPGTGTQTARDCDPVVNRPYVRVYGNDVATGGAFGSGTCTGGGGINMWARGANVGSGGQLSVLSLGPITEFSSAMLRSAAPAPPNGLTFANTVNPPGQFGGSHCISDFFAPAQSASFDNSNVAINLANVPDGTVIYRQPAGGIVRINGTVDRGKQVKIYVRGNVHINGNITYFNPNTWNSTADIASLHLIVQGNIYIGSNVTQIDGLYVAQPANASTGIIYTCVNPFSAAPFAATDLFAFCANQLTINGSLAARHIKWLRTYSSLRHSVAGEHPQGANHPCGGGSPSSRPVCAAEIVNFMPEVYLAIPASPNNAPASLGNYDYITSLPPTL